ncbi:hypothetical protein LCGC14_1487700, partial [marine sediment metagenome]
MSTYVSKKHDIGITPTSGEAVGMMLVQDKGVPRYQVFSDEYLASQFFTGLPGYSNLRPEKELQVGGVSWRSGFGLEFFDSLDPERYYYTINGDGRFKDMFVLGPKATTVTKPAELPTCNNTSFETNTSGWTTVSGTWARSAAQGHAGSASILQSNAGGGVATFSLSNPTNYQGLPLMVGGWIYPATGGSFGKIGIEDDSGTTWSANSGSATDAWEFEFAIRTIDGSASFIKIHLHADQDSTYFDDLFPASTGSLLITVFMDYNDKLYMGSGSQLAKLNGGGTA